MSFPELNRDPLFNTIMNRREKELEQLIPETRAEVPVMRIKLLAEYVIKAMSEDVEKAKIFLEKISYLDSFIKTKRPGLASLTGEVQRLRESLAHIVPRSIRGTQSLSTPPPLPSKVTTSSPSLLKSTATVPTSGVGARTFGIPLTFEAVKQKIKALTIVRLSDKGSLAFTTFSESIKEIKANLAKIEKSGEINHEQMKALSDQLDTLLNPYAFRASIHEREFLKRCAKKYPKLKAAMKTFDEKDKAVQEEARSTLLAVIKSFVDKPSTPVSDLSAKRNALELNLIKLRFSKLEGVTSSSPFNKHFINHLPSLIRAFEDFTLKANETVSKGWNDMLLLFEDIHNNNFNKTLKNYPYMDPAAFFADFEKEMQKQYFKLVEMEVINESPSVEPFLRYLDKASAEIPTTFFAASYPLNFYKKHEWLTKNFDHIVKVYNQAEAAHTNLGEGVCFQNCLDRSSVLLNNPKIADREIQTGSTQVGRFHQAKTKSEVRSRIGLITPKEILAIQTESSKRLGLTLREVMQASGDSPSSAIAALSKALNDEYIKNGKNLLCVLGLFSLDAGHAINIQINNADKEYRFIDDNLGICSEFASAKEFMQALKDYLKAYYEDYNKFSIQIYDKIPS